MFIQRFDHVFVTLSTSFHCIDILTIGRFPDKYLFLLPYAISLYKNCDRDWLVDNVSYQECKVVELFKIGKTHICEGKLISIRNI